jgi:hypothetical protein
MLKKVFLVLVAVLVTSVSTPVWAGPLGLSAIGVYGSAGSASGSLGGGVGLALKWGSFPVVGLQYNLVSAKVNASFDYYVIDAKGFASSFSYFLGAGGYAGIGTSGSGAAFDLGLRIPVGVQFWPVSGLELFASPVLTIPLLPSPQVGFGAEFGLRVRI